MFLYRKSRLCSALYRSTVIVGYSFSQANFVLAFFYGCEKVFSLGDEMCRGKVRDLFFFSLLDALLLSFAWTLSLGRWIRLALADATHDVRSNVASASFGTTSTCEKDVKNASFLHYTLFYRSSACTETKSCTHIGVC